MPRGVAFCLDMKSFFLACCFSFPLFADATEQLNIFVWPEFLPKNVVEKFEKSTGCKVTVEEYTSNEDMIAKVSQGESGYDLVCPSDYAVASMIRLELLRHLEREKIPALGNVAARFQKPKYDAEGKYAVPFLAGTTGLGIRSDKVTGVTKWADLFDDKRLAELQGKVSVIDDPKEGPAPAFLTLGLNPNSSSDTDLSKVEALLTKQKAFLAGYDSETFEDTLVNGQTYLVQGYSGDFAEAMKSHANITYLIPAEGCVVSVDNWAVLKDAKHADMAHQFIQFVLQPEIAAEVTNKSGYISCNGKAESFIDGAVKQHPTYQLPAAEKSFTLEDLGQEAEDKRNELWTNLKAN
jgi:spermidine/putrescine-binding protein